MSDREVLLKAEAWVLFNEFKRREHDMDAAKEWLDMALRHTRVVYGSSSIEDVKIYMREYYSGKS